MEITLKIGILTHPLTENYGGILQAAALYGYLTAQGHDVLLLRRHRNRPMWKNLLIFLAEHLPFQNIRNYKYLARKRRKQRPFIDNYIPSKTGLLYNTRQLKRALRDNPVDAIIVGSDQVWRMASINDGYFTNYFLDFAGDDVKKISYAASFGVDHWEAPARVSEVRALLQRFKAVSVREETGVTICRNNFDRIDCQLVLDPTLLVSREFYEKFTIDSGQAGNGYLLSYILDSSKEKALILEKVLNMQKSGWEFKDIFAKDKILTVAEWIQEFSAASYVVTDSFHGMVISIIFQKNFVVVANRKRGLARFLSLGAMLGLEDRIIESDSQLDAIMARAIDYSEVNRKLADMQAHSRAYLESSLI